MTYGHLHEGLSRDDKDRLSYIYDSLKEIQYSFDSLTAEVEYITQFLDSSAVGEFCRHDGYALDEIAETISALAKIISNKS